jgi:hypothetical protein
MGVVFDVESDEVLCESAVEGLVDLVEDEVASDGEVDVVL